MGCVYFLQARRQGSQRIKIGRTVICPFVRTGQIKTVFRQYRDYHLLGIIGTNAPVRDEAAVKRRFQRWQDHGEFFLPAADLQRFIRANAAIHICTHHCFSRTAEQLRAIEATENRREKHMSFAFERITAPQRSRYNTVERRIQKKQSWKRRRRAQ